MQAKLTLAMALSSLFLAACSSSSNSSRAVPTPPPSPVTSVITARFDPTAGVIPLPNNLLLSGTRDLTLNPPAANPANFGDPTVAIGTLDGWSTVGAGSTSFSTPPLASSIRPGQTVRMFEVSLSGPGGGVTGVTRELTSPADFVTALAPSDATGRTLAIVPTAPLKQLTSYLVVMTNGITDAAGTPTTPDQTYFLTKRPDPLINPATQVGLPTCTTAATSTDPLLPIANACALEPLRRLTNSHLGAAASRGIDPGAVVSSWVFTTQSITPVLQAVRSRVAPGATRLAPSGQTTAVAGLPPIGDIYIGTITLPYYLRTATQAGYFNGANGQPLPGPLAGFWRAAPNGYVPPFAGALDPTSTNITFANPFPVKQADVTVPVLMTVPNAASGRTKPAAGWPVVIFNHGITRNRTDALAISATLASQGFVVVAIDQPLHGLPRANPLNIENTPLGPLAEERTFDVDYINNTTGAAGPDGVADTSGAHTINLSSLLTSRDNFRQASADLFVLAASVPSMDLDANGAGDFDGSRISFVGQSLGSITGLPFLAIDPTVNVGLLNVGGGNFTRLVLDSATFRPRILAGLAGVGLQPNTPDFDRFFGAAQQVMDSADPVNFGFASAQNAIVMQIVIGDTTANILPDQVVPNSSSEALVRALGLPPIVGNTPSTTGGVRGVVRFIRGDHASLLSPAASPAATAEMQRQMLSFIGSGGAALLVEDRTVIRTQ